MANYEALKANIAQYIKENHENDITGNLLQQQLLAMVNSLGVGYQFVGTAQKTTNPGTPDQKVFYIPNDGFGAYPNFGLELAPGEIALFYYNGEWMKSFAIDSFTKDVIRPNLKKYITIAGGFWVDKNIVYFDGPCNIAYKDIDGTDVTVFQLSGKYVFSDDGTVPNYLVRHSNGGIEMVAGSSSILATDSVILSYYGEDTNLYYGLLSDQVNAKLLNCNCLIPADSMLDNNTPLYESGAGVWELRSAGQGNSISKLDGYFHINISRTANPALWITKLNLSPFVGDYVYVRFFIRTSYNLTFLVGSSESLISISANADWQEISTKLVVGDSYGDYRIMLYSGQPSAEFDIRDIKIVQFDTDKEKYALFLKKNGMYFFNTNKLTGKKISILGDSISTFGVPDQNNAIGLWTYPGNRCRYPDVNAGLTEVRECYWKRLIDNFGMFLGINESWAGSRVSNNQPTDSGDFGPNRCISSQTRIGHLGNNGTPDIILVYAGTNDAGGGVTIGTFNTENPKDYTDEQIAALPVVTFADAYRAMLIRLLKTYPNARIIVILPNLASTYYSITNLDSYIEVIKEECDFFGVKYIDTRTAGIAIYNQGIYLPDGIHPNGAGMDLIYKLLCREIFDELSKTGL